MSNSEAIRSKKLEVGSAVIIAAFSGFLTLAGVMSASLVGWISVYQSSAASLQQSCIARADAQEQALRAKADAYLSSLGALMALDGRVSYKSDQLNERLDEVMKAAYSFSAYSPESLTRLTTNSVTQLKAAIQHSDDKVQFGAYITDYRKYKAEWDSGFQDFLKDFETQRLACTERISSIRMPEVHAF